MGNRKYIEKLIFISLLVSLSVVLGIVDTFLSSFMATQGVRIGLANIVILTGLYYLNFKESIVLIVFKSLLTGFILGNPITFFVGFSGTLFSFLIMYTLLVVGRNKISLVGVSISGGVAHNIGQIFALVFSGLYAWTISFSLMWLIPMGIGTGIFIGYTVNILKVYLNKGQVFKTITTSNTHIDLSHLIDDEG